MEIGKIGRVKFTFDPEAAFTPSIVPVRVTSRLTGTWAIVPTMVLSTLALLVIVTFMPWAVPLLMPRI